MSPDFDEGSFPKVRGWLLAFSSTIIALWFFGADLKSVSVLGTNIDFTRNTEYVWLVALAVNGYFLLRFYQHQPEIQYFEWAAYRKCYHYLMINLSRLLHKKLVEERVFEQGGVYSPSNLEGRSVECKIESADMFYSVDQSETRRYIAGKKHAVFFHAYCVVSDKQGDHAECTRTHEVLIDSPYWLVCICVWLSKVKIWITTSYATEYLLPYIWSGLAGIVCLVRWYAAVDPVMKWCA